MYMVGFFNNFDLRKHLPTNRTAYTLAIHNSRETYPVPPYSAMNSNSYCRQRVEDYIRLAHLAPASRKSFCWAFVTFFPHYSPLATGPSGIVRCHPNTRPCILHLLHVYVSKEEHKTQTIAHIHTDMTHLQF